MSLLIAALLAASAPDDGLVTVPCAFQPVFFEAGSTIIAAEWLEHGYLDHFQVFSPASRARIMLMGIATDGGSERANRRLARRRAEIVRHILVARGVRRERVRIVTSHPDLAGLPLSSTEGRAV